jgi:hypothetical protein
MRALTRHGGVREGRELTEPLLDDAGVVCQMRLFSKVDPICTRICEKKRSLHLEPKHDCSGLALAHQR